MKKLLYLLIILPLSACFDADLSLTVHDSETATMSANMTMGPELIQMIASSGQDPCEDGVGVQNADGSYSCLVEEPDTIDNLIAKIEEEEANAGAAGSVNPNTGVTIERMEGGLIRLSFDLLEIKRNASETGMDPAMLGAFQSAMTGHGIQMSIRAKEIISTNGSLSEDGTVAMFGIPLPALLDPAAQLPDSFETVVRPD